MAVMNGSGSLAVLVVFRPRASGVAELQEAPWQNTDNPGSWGQDPFLTSGNAMQPMCTLLHSTPGQVDLEAPAPTASCGDKAL